MDSNFSLSRRVVLCSIALGLPAHAQPTRADVAEALRGRWRSLATSSGGIGSMFEFGADGGLDFSPGAVVEMSYRVEGDELVLPSATVNGPAQREAIEWLGPDAVRFRLPADPGNGEEFKRVGPPRSAVDPLLGEWTGRREMAGREVKVVRLFRPNGRLLLLIQFFRQHGGYAVADRQLTLTLPGRPAALFGFDIAEPTLTLTASDGKKLTFERY